MHRAIWARGKRLAIVGIESCKSCDILLELTVNQSWQLYGFSRCQLGIA